MDAPPSNPSAPRATRSAILGHFLHRRHPANSHEYGVTVESLESHCARHGRLIDAHYHADTAQVILVAVGNGVMTLDDQAHPFAAPAILVLPVRVVHSFSYGEDANGWVVSISMPFLNQVLARAGELHEIWSSAGVVDCADDSVEFSDIVTFARRLHGETHSVELGGAVAREAFLLGLLVEVLRQCRRRRGDKAAKWTGDTEILKRYLELVELHFSEKLTIDQYCNLMNVSQAQLRTACGAERPISILHNRILSESRRRLLYTQLSVSEIGYSLGFEDPSYFARFFKQKTGETPAQYRLKGQDRAG